LKTSKISKASGTGNRRWTIHAQQNTSNKEGQRTRAKEDPQRAKIFAPGQVAVGRGCPQTGAARKQALQSI
jgi:hypothetical protein